VRVVIFTHSLVSDWNHGNAHFLRGIVCEMLDRGMNVQVFEPEDGWSRQNLVADQGQAALEAFEQQFPQLRSTLYDPKAIDLNAALDGAEIVLVHEWSDPELVGKIGEHRARRGTYRLFFHDTHHRAVTAPLTMRDYPLHNYDGVLAYGEVLRNIYRKRRWAREAWTWHEAADTRTFYPREVQTARGDLVWIGNWGDEERAEELREFLIQPVKDLKLKAAVYGVRYPASALRELEEAGIEYRGWLPNYRVPEVMAQFRLTVHIPRRPYATSLTGIPTIRPFEALACGLPLISAPWTDSEHLFRPDADFLFAQTGARMTSLIATVLCDSTLGHRLSESGLQTIRERHTCGHRVDELLGICQELARRAPVGEVA